MPSCPFVPCGLIMSVLAFTATEDNFFVRAHSRLACPEPRDPATGLKNGPCGTANDDGSDYFEANDVVYTVAPGPFTITWEESIAHSGAPWRISLSGESSDTSNVCVLLDHIPHSPSSEPIYSDEDTWTPYSVTVQIPDVNCQKCSIHLTNPMTDKIGDAKYADGIGCCDPGSESCTASTTPAMCSSVYHSCSVPLQITGSTPRNQYICPGQPTDWPTTWSGTSSSGAVVSVNTATLGVYRQESGSWVDNQLANVPARYNEQHGICGNETINSPVDTTASGLTHLSSIVAFVALCTL